MTEHHNAFTTDAGQVVDVVTDKPFSLGDASVIRVTIDEPPVLTAQGIRDFVASVTSDDKCICGHNRGMHQPTHAHSDDYSCAECGSKCSKFVRAESKRYLTGFSGESMKDPDIEQMERDLRSGGWEEVSFSVWRAPWGALFRGPHRAWHVWAGTPMCEPRRADD